MSTINVLKTVLSAEDQGFTRVMKAAEEKTRDYNKVMKQAEEVYKATRTPLEQYEAGVAKLDAMLKRGAIDQQTFNRAMSDLAKPTSGIAAAFARITPTIDVASLAMRGFSVAADAVRGVIGTVADALQRIDELDDTAHKLGVSTEALSAFRYAAGFAGVEATTMDKAIGTMNVNISKATDKGGALAEAFTKLGLDAKKLREVGTEKAFAMIADAVSGLDGKMRQTAAAQEIFGKRGKELVGILGEGAAAFEASREEAVRWGIAINEVDASRVAQANDALTKLDELSKGAANTLASDLAPAIKTVADMFAKMVDDAGSMDKLIGGWVESLEGFVVKAMNVLDILERADIGGIGAIGRGGAPNPRFGAPLAGDVFARELAKNKAAIAAAAANAPPPLDIGNDGASALGNTPFDREAERLRESLRTPLEVLQDELTKFGDMFAEGSIDVETLNRALEKAEADYEKTMPKMVAGKMENNIPPPAGQSKPYDPSLAALEQGSSAAFSAINRARGGAGSTAEKQLDVARRQQKLQEQIAANTARKPMVANIA